MYAFALLFVEAVMNVVCLLAVKVVPYEARGEQILGILRNACIIL